MNMPGILLSFVLITGFVYGINALTCNRPSGPCKCMTDMGEMDLTALDGSDFARYVAINTLKLIVAIFYWVRKT